MLGFRALQAIMDLRAAAGRHARPAVRGIAARIPPADRARGADERALTRLILHQGGRLERARDIPLLDALQLAATQPGADPDAFVAATAVLISDRLQHGLGRVDLAVYWDSFRDSYAQLAGHDRAAIVQGFLALAAAGQITLAPPTQTSRTTTTAESVRTALRLLAERGRDALHSAVGDAVAPQVGALVLPQLRALLATADAPPLTGDSPLFAPLLALATNRPASAWVPATAVLLSEAVRSGDAEGWFGVTLWSEMAAAWLALEGDAGTAILSGLRHLYESESDWRPMPDRAASPGRMEGVILLPVLDAGHVGGEHRPWTG